MSTCTNCHLAHTIVLMYLVLHIHILSTLLTAHDNEFNEYMNSTTAFLLHSLTPCSLFFISANSFFHWIHWSHVFNYLFLVVLIWLPFLFLWSIIGTNIHKKELFVMALRTPKGKTFPGNFAIISSSKKWVFHAILCLTFLSLYGEHICSLNRLVLTDEEDAEYWSCECLIATHKAFQLLKVMLCAFHAVWQPFQRDLYPFLPSIGGPVEKTWFFSNGPNSTSECSKLLY